MSIHGEELAEDVAVGGAAALDGGFGVLGVLEVSGVWGVFGGGATPDEDFEAGHARGGGDGEVVDGWLGGGRVEGGIDADGVVEGDGG